MNHELSIVILTLNSDHFIYSCLASIYYHAQDINFEVIVVDNNSQDNTRNIIRNNFPKVKVLEMDSNLGVSITRNKGIECSTGEYVLLLDDDTKIEEGTVQELLKQIKQDKNCGICGPVHVSYSGKRNYNCLPLPTLREKFIRFSSKLFNIEIKTPYLKFIDSGKSFSPGYLLGATLLIRKEALNKVGLLDENIFYGPEDADLCLRMRLGGYSVKCFPHVEIVHNYRRLTINNIFSKLTFKHIQGLTYYFRKHKYLLHPPTFS